MNTAEWRRCTNPRSMIPYLSKHGSARRRRLFTAGCCRRIVNLITEERCRRLRDEAIRFGSIDEADPIGPDFLLSALALAERCADAPVAEKELRAYPGRFARKERPRRCRA